MLSDAKLIGFVATQNPTKARQFYESTIGLKFVSGDDFALVFDANGIMLRVQKVDRLRPQEFTVLGWNVSDIRKEVAELSNRGVHFHRYEGMKQDELGIWTSPAGARIAWFTDPDGNILSVTQF